MTTPLRSGAGAGPSPPSREEIESLCIVHAAGLTWCSLTELAARLGLSRDLSSVMADAVAPLVAAGRVELQDGMVRATDAGWDWLQRRLAELGHAQ